MASGSNYLTTYYAKRIIGDTNANTCATALLQSGVTDSMWIFGHSRSNYGIRYIYDNTTADKIQFHGGSDSNCTAYIQLNTGDASFSGALSVTSDASIGGNLSITGTATATGGFVGDLTGNADTATKWATACYFTIEDNDGTNSATTSSGFDGSADITLKLPSTIKAALSGNASSATRINGNLSPISTNTNCNIWVSSNSSASGIPNYIAGCYINADTGTVTAKRMAVKNDTINLNASDNGYTGSGNTSYFLIQDSTGASLARVAGGATTDSKVYVQLSVRGRSDTLNENNQYPAYDFRGITIYMNKSGTVSYAVSTPSAFRTALELGTAATHAHEDYAPSSTISCTTDNVKTALSISSSGSATKWLNEKGSWVSITAANVGASASDHTHGNITNGGCITTAITIANNDYLIIGDSSASGKLGKGPVFDASTATKCLTQKGTWEDFNNYEHPTTAGNKHIPSGGSSGQFLKYSSSGTATWSALPSASDSVAGITLVGASGGAAAYDHTHSYLSSGGGTLTGGILMRHQTWVKGTEYTSNQSRAITYYESGTGTDAKNRTAMIYAYAPANTTDSRIGFYAYKNAANSSSNTYFFLQYGSNDVKRTVTDAKVYGAIWNDYAEYRKTNDEAKPGQVVIDNDDGTLSITNKRLQLGAQVVSDTFGFAIGETDKHQTPLAVSGRVLVYPYRAREEYHAGMSVCSAPNGTVDIMTRDEIMMYPDAIVGIVSEIPDYEEWGQDNIKVDKRIWIRVK